MTKKLYVFNFTLGSINAIASQMIPLIFIVYGFQPGEISTLLSLVFFAALFQPLIGALTKKKTGTFAMIITVIIVMIIMAILLYNFRNIYVVAITLLVFSVARLATGPLNDSLVSRMAISDNVNYGFVRSGASLGFGLGMMIFTAIASIFKLTEPSSLYLIVVFAITALAMISGLKGHNLDEESENIEVADSTNWKLFILLSIIYMLYYGGLTLRVTYISTYYVEFDYSTAFISFTTMIMVLPEVIVMPFYNRLFGNFDKIKLLFTAISLGIIQIILYIVFRDSVPMLILTSLFNGFQIMIFLPSFAAMMQSSLGKKNSSLGFILNVTLQSLFVALINQTVIKHFYVSTNSTIPIFLIIIVIMGLAFIPLFIYNLKVKKYLN